MAPGAGWLTKTRWLPISVRFGATGAEVLWADLAAARWDRDAFFDHTVMAHVGAAGSRGSGGTPSADLLDSPAASYPPD